jgi:thiamine-monophosphate kinase
MGSEFELIARIRSAFGRRGDRVLEASGDDAAIVRVQGVSATSTDAFVEGVHFRLATTSLGDLGHKCLAAGLSDLAAMGATAGEAYLALGLPPSMGEREVLELVAGAERLAAETATTICGGDVTSANELFVVVTSVGYAEREDALVTRSGAEPEEIVGVTGKLGGAGAGLLLLERKEHGLPVDVGEPLIDRQRRPQPRLEVGRALAATGVTAMIDVSDGIASDAARLAEESGVAVEIELPRLPLDDGVEAVAASVGRSGIELAASAGEDYELLFTVPSAARAEVERITQAAGVPVSWIGRTLAGGGVRLLDERSEPRRIEGWDHLARRSSSPRRGPA